MFEFSVSPHRSDSETFVDASAELSADPSSMGPRLPDVVRLPTGAADLPWADAAIAGQCVISDESVARMRAGLLSRRSRLAFSAMKIFLIVALVVTPFACMFAYIDIATASIMLSTAVRSTKSVPSQSAAPAAAGDVDGWSKVQLATSSTGAAMRLGDMPNVTEEKMTAPQPVPDTEKTTTAPEIDDHNSSVAANLRAVKTSQLAQSQPGVWTHCAVNLIPIGQIAVQKAVSYRSCISVGKKCAGARRYASIQYFDRPTWVSSASLDVCDAES
jgi:hypothetical protein